MLNDIYDAYKSNQKMAIEKKDFYTDRQGYLNENAFYHFTKKIAANKELPDYYLICFNIDLRRSNSESIAVGDYVLRRFIISLEDYYVFRIQGEKFNMLVTKEQIPTVKNILDKPSNKYKIYYGIVQDIPYKPLSASAAKDVIRKGIALMYANKGEKVSDTSGNIISNKGNTPKELQETKYKKYRSTMWYSIAHITIIEPVYKEVDLYIFPTEWKEPLLSIPIIVAAYDSLSYNVKYGSNVTLGISGIKFNISCRFDKEEHLTVAVCGLDKCKCDIKIDTFEGVCIPATFGKRLSATKELYPLRKNATGYYDYVLFEEGSISVDLSGFVTSANGLKYGVYMDDECINLIQL